MLKTGEKTKRINQVFQKRTFGCSILKHPVSQDETLVRVFIVFMACFGGFLVGTLLAIHSSGGWTKKKDEKSPPMRRKRSYIIVVGCC